MDTKEWLDKIPACDTLTRSARVRKQRNDFPRLALRVSLPLDPWGFQLQTPACSIARDHFQSHFAGQSAGLAGSVAACGGVVEGGG